MKFAVLGGGNGAFATAAHLALEGFDVSLFELPRFAANIKAARARGGIELIAHENTGLRSGFGKLSRITTDAEEALEGVDVMMVAAPSFAHVSFANACSPFIRDGQIVILTPGNPGGALAFANYLKGIGLRKDIVIGETASLIYGCWRGEDNVEIGGFKRNGFTVAAFPAKSIKRVHDVLRPIYPDIVPANSIFETGMSNPNTVQHIPTVLMNVGWIERTRGDFRFYVDGVTTSVGRVIEAVDAERVAVGEAMNINLIPMKDLLLSWYGHEGAKGDTMEEVLVNMPCYQGVKAPTNLMERVIKGRRVVFPYVIEDVPYGMVPMAEIGRKFGVETPIVEAHINLASVIMESDYRKEGRTIEKMGLASLRPREISKLLSEGNPLGDWL